MTIEGQATAPEPPEAMFIYRRLRALDLPLVAGGLLAQPHIYLIEQEAVLMAIMEQDRVRAVNAAIKARQNAPA